MSCGICLVDVEQRRRDLVEFGAALGLEHRLAGVEEHLRLQHETVADDADIGAVAEDVAQPAEEVGAIARQFLHALRQRHVQPLAEVGDARLRLLVLFLRDVQRLFQRAELAAQRRDLLVEHFDLGERAERDLLLGVELAGQVVRLVLRGGVAAAQALVKPLVAVALGFGGGEAGAQLRDLLLQRHLAGLFEPQQIGELRDARRQARQRGVLAGDLLRQHELHDHEHREQEDDAEDQRRQRVDEAGPVIDAAIAAGAG